MKRWLSVLMLCVLFALPYAQTIVQAAEPTVTQIYVTPPTKRYYHTSDTKLDTTGLQVWATYSTGATTAVQNYTVSGFTSAVGQHTITVTSNGKKATFDILVNTLGRAPTSAELVNNPALFLPVWAGVRQSHASSFAEKKQQFLTPGGRLMSVAHRGDNREYYPENSLEGALSVILYGADIVEMDIQRTKDNVLILMHDDTLTRTTDVADKKGKNGLPNSEKISDWTYQQLQQLRLLNPNGSVSNCQIPTLKQGIQLCKNRAFITLDKSYNFNWTNDVYPLIKQVKAYDTVLIPYNYSVSTAYDIQQTMLREVGTYALYYAKAQGDTTAATISALETAMTNLTNKKMDPALRGGEFDPDAVSQMSSVMAKIRGKYRYYIETLKSAHDKLSYWKQIDELGYGIIMGNHVYDLVDYIASKYERVMYGDINGDGNISVADVRLALRYSANKITLAADEKKRADVNRDNSVTVADVRQILRYTAGKISSFS